METRKPSLENSTNLTIAHMCVCVCVCVCFFFSSSFVYSPYHLACRAGHITIQKLLLSKGASGMTKNSLGVSASTMLLHTARKSEDEPNNNNRNNKNALKDHNRSRSRNQSNNQMKGQRRNNPRMVFRENSPSKGACEDSGMMQGIDRAFVRSMLRKNNQRTTCW